MVVISKEQDVEVLKSGENDQKVYMYTSYYNLCWGLEMKTKIKCKKCGKTVYKDSHGIWQKRINSFTGWVMFEGHHCD